MHARGRHLETSRIGPVVRALRGHPASAEARRLAGALLDKWRREVEGAPDKWRAGRGARGPRQAPLQLGPAALLRSGGGGGGGCDGGGSSGGGGGCGGAMLEAAAGSGPARKRPKQQPTSNSCSRDMSGGSESCESIEW